MLSHTHKSVILLISLLIVGLSIVAVGDAKTLKLGHIIAPGSLTNKSYTEVFKPYVEKETNGEIKIEVFPSGQLGSAPDQLEGVAMGAQDMFSGDLTWWQVYAPRAGLPSIPFTFEDREHFSRWLTGAFKEEAAPRILNRGNQRFINLNHHFHRGPYKVICSTKPIFSPADLKGLNLRLWPAELVQKAWRAMGVSVNVLDFSDVYIALQRNTIDAVTAPFDMVWAQKFTEVAKYVTELRQYPAVDVVTINENTWQSLSKKEQNILKEGITKAAEYYNSRIEETRNQVLKDIINEHNAVYIQVNRGPFIKLAHDKALPKLAKNGQIQEKWVAEVEEAM